MSDDSTSSAKRCSWIDCLCVVNFDLEFGQKLVYSFPEELQYSKEEIDNICFLAFPDSNSNLCRDVIYCFRCLKTRKTSATSQREQKIQNQYFFYGFVFFRQEKDSSIPRGYLQKSVVLLSEHPYFALFKKMLLLIGPLYFHTGTAALEAVFENISSQWPTPRIGTTVELPLLGHLLKYHIPDDLGADLRSEQISDASFAEHSKRIQTRMLVSNVHYLNLYKSFRAVLSRLWLLWELVLIGEPILIIASDPSVASDAVLGLISLISPLVYGGDFRPFFTIYNSDLKELTEVFTENQYLNSLSDKRKPVFSLSEKNQKIQEKSNPNRNDNENDDKKGYRGFDLNENRTRNHLDCTEETNIENEYDNDDDDDDEYDNDGGGGGVKGKDNIVHEEHNNQNNYIDPNNSDFNRKNAECSDDNSSGNSEDRNEPEETFEEDQQPENEERAGSRSIPVIVGVTNPYFLKIWNGKHILKLGSPAPMTQNRGKISQGHMEARHELQTTHSALIKVDRKKILEQLLPTRSRKEMHDNNNNDKHQNSKGTGFINRDRETIQQNYTKTMHFTDTDRNEERNNEILRKHFLQLTENFLLPLERYFASLIPLQRNMSIFLKQPQLKVFDEREFLSSIRQQKKGIFGERKANEIEFYRRFLHSPNFLTWFNARRKEAIEKVNIVYRNLLLESNVVRLLKEEKRKEVEIVDLLLKVREQLIHCLDKEVTTKLEVLLREIADCLPEDLRQCISIPLPSGHQWLYNRPSSETRKKDNLLENEKPETPP